MAISRVDYPMPQCGRVGWGRGGVGAILPEVDLAGSVTPSRLGFQ